ncbi:hypothetical protein BJ170DRAFT_626628 [Xylariales sp. AK1849]|nr:hypothetical protein BJ170DRAFT_626628 [Xylariales sp. AK1849]
MPSVQLGLMTPTPMTLESQNFPFRGMIKRSARAANVQENPSIVAPIRMWSSGIPGPSSVKAHTHSGRWSIFWIWRPLRTTTCRRWTIWLSTVITRKVRKLLKKACPMSSARNLSMILTLRYVEVGQLTRIRASVDLAEVITGVGFATACVAIGVVVGVGWEFFRYNMLRILTEKEY